MRKMTLFLGLALSLSCFSQNKQGYQNPVIPGYHPDSSVCRVGDDFYLVNRREVSMRQPSATTTEHST